MLIEFRFKNYRSFRDEAVLSMKSIGIKSYKNCLIGYGSSKLLPAVAIYGKNGGGKSNVIRAFWLAVKFICNAQKTQHENANVPVNAFALNDYSKNEPTEFHFIYTINDVKYWYGFSATKSKIINEYLYYAPNKQKAIVFIRDYQRFTFTTDKAKRTLISETIAENQLFFSVACTMNDAACAEAMRWFREFIIFSRDYSDISTQLPEYLNDSNMLKSISNYAKSADLGIEDMKFELNSQEIDNELNFPDDIQMPDNFKMALSQFIKVLSETSNNSEVRLKLGEVRATSLHRGITKEGEAFMYPLELSDESDGTRRLMSIAPAIEAVLEKGGVLLVDELEREMHPILLEYIVSKFQSKKTNSKNAQIIFTTHNTELLNLELLRKDQIYFVDKNNEDGSSELYSISDFGTKTAENIRKGYLLGKYGATPDIEIEEVD